ncbi:P-loop containing nucleoside triphosphate hydrolase protein [Gilbertella persicaria]|uniref:P-loop containing nucleoside triphosphate hydrolase protein n=1 Tax=Gilbertella persicaria TaxID=101096 RepID=UPI0022205FFB|nr:P-loop containing nucleoside triphosphate hydrolase protein [Gilbertella persicaria]KAI8073471.1 P-loop containing nucleoside triphosphate hydrolase protein [Gilbertella persicaria]
MSFLWSFGTKKEPTSPVPPAPTQSSFKTMSHAFKKGVQYNMKIILRGDVMTGKTSLFHRLQGSDFDDHYAATPQIQVANIPWHYKDSNDIVKIEVWDVVDKAHNKTKSTENSAIKLEHTEQKAPTNEESMELDAVTVNVYRNSHGVIFLFDMTKPWTFDYVNKELAHVPETMSVLVLGNFGDKVDLSMSSQERKVEIDTIHATLYEHNQDRIKKGAIKPNLIRYAEASMKTGLGLKYIYDYLGVPFLQLMMESLNKQLELKAVEIVDLLQTLDTEDDVPESMQRRRGQDNFDQPSEPRLLRQQEEMKSAWDQELEAIASDHPSFVRPETPPPPVAPVQSKKKKDIQLVSEQVSVDPFDHDEQLADDWFGEETPALTLQAQQEAYDSDDQGPMNPMVLGDEDVEPSLEQEYHAPVFKSELEEEAWHSNRRSISDSEEEEEEAYAEYEEISESNENPWSDWQEKK